MHVNVTMSYVSPLVDNFVCTTHNVLSEPTILLIGKEVFQCGFFDSDLHVHV